MTGKAKGDAIYRENRKVTNTSQGHREMDNICLFFSQLRVRHSFLVTFAFHSLNRLSPVTGGETHTHISLQEYISGVLE